MKRIDINEFRKSAAKRAYIEDINQRGERLTTAEVAEMLEITVEQTKRLAGQGEIPSYRLMAKRWFYRNEIMRFIQFAGVAGQA